MSCIPWLFHIMRWNRWWTDWKYLHHIKSYACCFAFLRASKLVATNELYTCCLRYSTDNTEDLRVLVKPFPVYRHLRFLAKSWESYTSVSFCICKASICSKIKVTVFCLKEFRWFCNKLNLCVAFCKSLWRRTFSARIASFAWNVQWENKSRDCSDMNSG